MAWKKEPSSSHTYNQDTHDGARMHLPHGAKGCRTHASIAICLLPDRGGQRAIIRFKFRWAARVRILTPLPAKSVLARREYSFATGFYHFLPEGGCQLPKVSTAEQPFLEFQTTCIRRGIRFLAKAMSRDHFCKWPLLL
jgi:hypothetical protein